MQFNALSKTAHQAPKHLCHCEEGQRPDVAISWYDIRFCTVEMALYREIASYALRIRKQLRCNGF